MRPALLLLSLAACTGANDAADQAPEPPAREPVALRVVHFNASLHRSAAGALADELEGDSAAAAAVAAILQRLRPDVLFVAEFDHDASGRGVAAFRDRYLAVGQRGREPLSLPHVFAGPVNTGVPSGADLDGDGVSDHPEGSQGYANDARVFGVHPGQYGMAVFSRFPITATRAVTQLLWKDAPFATLPDDPATEAPGDFYSPAALAALPLSSKAHWDVTLDVDGAPLHLLASHPTPPAFDGPEDRNGLRNADEIKLWTAWLDDADWLADDAGLPGGLDASAAFVLVGDLNSDPSDGGSRPDAIASLLAHPRVADPAPRSAGGAAAAAAQGGANAGHRGDPALDTADFSDGSVGNLRVDYVLPSAGLVVHGTGVDWPVAGDEDADLLGDPGTQVSDHRPVWLDLTF